MSARFHVDVTDLQPGQTLSLPPGPARHVQVLRLQPGDDLRLFNGQGGEWQASILRMGRSEVEVTLLAHVARDVEWTTPVTLIAGIPANDRFDWLVEKATELGVHCIQPVLTSRSVFKLSGERALRKREHWQGVAISAAQQCGATRVPEVKPLRTLNEALQDLRTLPGGDSWVLSLREAQPLAARWTQRPEAQAPLTLISGPEGGLSEDEESAALRAGALAVSLGGRVLRAETAPLVVLSWIAALSAGSSI